MTRFAAVLMATTFITLTAAHAGPELVQNGGFEQVTMPNGPSQINKTNVANWSTSGYNFIFSPGAPATYVTEYNSYLGLWGNDGTSFLSPTGGNFVGADGNYQVGAITQTINGLTAGQNYTLKFDWAAAQQQGFDGPTTEKWTATLGAQSFTTPTFKDGNHAWSGWMSQTFTYTATSASEVLSFLAGGSPNGEPPFSLLDSVSLTAVPEPAGWAVLASGMLAVGALRLRRRRLSGVSEE